MAKNLNIYIDLTPDDKTKFNAAIADMVKVSGASWQKVVRNMARDVSREALRLTPAAPNTRKIPGVKGGSSAILVPAYRARFAKQRKTDGSPSQVYWVDIIKNGEKKVYPGTLREAEKYSENYSKLRNRGLIAGGNSFKTPHRGFMKAGWVAALAKLGVNINNSAGRADRFGFSTEQGANNSNFMITIRNAIPFVYEFDKGRNRWKTRQGIVESAIRTVSKIWNEQRIKKAAIAAQRRK